MAKTRQAKDSGPAITEETVEHLARVAGIDIAPDRLPGAAKRLTEMLAFLEQIENLVVEDIAPAAVFDPSWQE